MLKHLIKQLRNVILLTHLQKLDPNAIWENGIIAWWMEQLIHSCVCRE
jgi:hypothetical protein